MKTAIQPPPPVENIIRRLAELKITIAIIDGNISLKAKPGVITQKCKEVIKAQKDAILAYLEAQQQIAFPTACHHCGEPMESSDRDFNYWPRDSNGQYTTGSDYIRVVGVCSVCKSQQLQPKEEMDLYRETILPSRKEYDNRETCAKYGIRAVHVHVQKQQFVAHSRPNVLPWQESPSADFDAAWREVAAYGEKAGWPVVQVTCYSKLLAGEEAWCKFVKADPSRSQEITRGKILLESDILREEEEKKKRVIHLL